MFCSNRFLLPGSPTTCALDAGITPLPSIFLLAFILVYVPIRLLSRRSSSLSSYKYESPGAQTGAARGKWLHYTYLVLVACLLGLRVLEIARLIAADMGVALLPFGIVANALAIVMLSYGGMGLGMGHARRFEISISLVLYWALSTILEAVKVARLATYNQFNPAKGTAYPSSDWLLDNGCMLGLLVIFLFVEGTYCILLWRSTTLVRGGTPRDMEISKPTLVHDSLV